MKKELRALLDWWKTEGRTFPWRDNPTPYNVLISEWMLQRTRADLVVPVYVKFINRFPSFGQLANASEQDWQDVKHIVSSLGRVRRVEDLQRTVKEISSLYKDVPCSLHVLEKIHGMGMYTARAIAVFGCGQRFGLVDPNVLRILERFWGIISNQKRPRNDKRLWLFLDKILADNPDVDAKSFNWALIDLGAAVCRSKPICYKCPLMEWGCSYVRNTKNGKV